MANSEKINLFGFVTNFEQTEATFKVYTGVKNALEARGYPVTLLRIPGGSPVTDRIRKIILEDGHKFSIGTLQCLLKAAVMQIEKDVLNFAIKEGRIIICKYEMGIEDYMTYRGFVFFLDYGEACDEDNGRYRECCLFNPERWIQIELDPEPEAEAEASVIDEIVEKIIAMVGEK